MARRGFRNAWRRQRGFSLLRLALLSLWLVVALFPVYWMVATSFKPQMEWLAWPPTWVPQNPTLENYTGIFTTGTTKLAAGEQHFTALNPLRDSLIISFMSCMVALMLGTFLAYGVSRYRTGGRNLPYMVLLVRMVPPIVIAVPFLVYYSTLRLLDSYLGLILIYVATSLPYVVWMMLSFIGEVPLEIEHAARLMGAGPLTILRKVTLPLVSPGLVVTFLFTFILNWSEFLFALTLSGHTVITMTVQLSQYYAADLGRLFGPQAAFGTLAVIPLIVLGIAIQKHLVKGFSFGLIRK